MNNAQERHLETVAVTQLGDAIGYGRLMQLAEQIWHRIATERGHHGSEHTVGACAAFMVPCPHPERDQNGHCEWCCGAGRLTKRVAEVAKDFKRKKYV